MSKRTVWIVIAVVAVLVLAWWVTARAESPTSYELRAPYGLGNRSIDYQARLQARGEPYVTNGHLVQNVPYNTNSAPYGPRFAR